MTDDWLLTGEMTESFIENKKQTSRFIDNASAAISWMILPVESRDLESTVEHEMLKYHNRSRGEGFPCGLAKIIKVVWQTSIANWFERILGVSGEWSRVPGKPRQLRGQFGNGNFSITRLSGRIMSWRAKTKPLVPS
jgi:hypothetical protein